MYIDDNRKSNTNVSGADYHNPLSHVLNFKLQKKKNFQMNDFIHYYLVPFLLRRFSTISVPCSHNAPSPTDSCPSLDVVQQFLLYTAVSLLLPKQNDEGGGGVGCVSVCSSQCWSLHRRLLFGSSSRNSS